MKKKLALVAPVLTVTLLAAACSGGGSGAGAASEDQVFNLKLASYNLATAMEGKATGEWAEQVEEATDGRVQIEIFYQEALLSGAETLPGVADGRADLGYITAGYYPAELPLTSVSGVPFLSEDLAAQGRAFQDLYENNDAYRDEWASQGVHVLHWAPVESNIVALKEPATSLADLEGRKIRGYGYVSQALEAAGASAVALGQGEVYEALQRGVLDGTSGAPLDVMADRDFYEVAPHLVDINSGNYAVGANVISTEVWESLPEDLRTTITEVSEGYLDLYLGIVEEAEKAACDEILEGGGEITILDESDTAQWREAAGAEIRQVWADDVRKSADGVDPDAFFTAFTDALASYEEGSDHVPAAVACAAR